MKKDKVKGNVKNVQGKAQEAAGKAIDNKEMQVKGKVKQVEGKAQEKISEAKENLKKSID